VRRERQILLFPPACRLIEAVPEITPEMTVYRYSPAKVVEYLKIKVARLAQPEVFEISRTLVRNLAKNVLMEDEMEGLLESTPISVSDLSDAHCISGARLRASCDMLAQYLSPNLHASLLATYEYAVP
jgi:ribonuclease H2 subunit B